MKSGLPTPTEARVGNYYYLIPGWDGNGPSVDLGFYISAFDLIMTLCGPTFKPQPNKMRPVRQGRQMDGARRKRRPHKKSCSVLVVVVVVVCRSLATGNWNRRLV